MTQQLTLTDTVLLNSWFVSILEGLYGYSYQSYLMLLYVQSSLSIEVLFLTVKVFFLSRLKDQPHPCETTQCSSSNHVHPHAVCASSEVPPSNPKVFINVHSLANESHLDSHDKLEREILSKKSHLIWDNKTRSMYRPITISSNLIMSLNSDIKTNNV